MKRGWIVICLVASLSLFACGTDDKDGVAEVTPDTSVDAVDVPDTADTPPDAPDACLPAPLTDPLTLQSADGQASLTVEPDPFQIVLRRGDRALASFPVFGLGVVPEVDDDRSYDPYWFYRDIMGNEVEKIPEDLSHVAASGVHQSAACEGSSGPELLLELTGPDEHTMTLKIVQQGDAGFTLDLATGDPEQTALSWFQWPMADGEQFYGTGERFDTVAVRGTLRAMQHEARAGESGYNEAHVPVPLLVSTRAYGVFVEEPRPGILDLGTIEEDQARIEFEARALKIHLLTAPTPLEVLTPYVQITGLPSIPSWWAFAPQQWRNAVTGSDMVLEDALAMREHELPCGVIWIDRPWEKTYHDFIFDPDMFPDPQQMIDDLHDLGYRVVVWSASYQTPDSDVWDEVLEKDLLAGLPDGWPTASYSDEAALIDFTNPDAQELWRRLVHRVTDMGVEGFKLDYAEDVHVGIAGTRTKFSFFNGEDERTMHHRYQLFYHQPYAEVLGKNNGFIMSRAGMYGDQALSNAIWPGDLDSDFSYHGEKVDGKPMVGGLPAAIRAGLSLGASGYPIFASDTGGFRNDRPTKEVILRWAQHTALTPILQLGGGSVNHNVWDFEPAPHYDQETVDIYRVYADLHIRLFPYIFTYARLAGATGLPVQRAFGLVEPDDGRHPSDQYFFGAELYVAPVEREVTTKTVELPPGQWVDWWSGELKQGPDTFEAEAPLETLPLYVKLGSVLPMLPPGIQTLSDRLELDPEAPAPTDMDLHLLVVAGSDGAFEVYDGSTVELTWNGSLDDMKVSMQGGDIFGAFHVEMMVDHLEGRRAGPPRVRAISADGRTGPVPFVEQGLAGCAAPCAGYDPRTGHLHVKPPVGAVSVSVSL